ncbi:DUF4097 family beta strand repeat-containing protein [Paenibacillus pinihumi]|uniref:DUF4097 family beta strand repeat-containing protein n=1 Tax=Paenibacillus pinihumi TaxID=669462 RepID=UPI000400CAC3|nr:DUF4097 family beta strand repeat-containing protein [Paenibacillus pinihumi]
MSNRLRNLTRLAVMLIAVAIIGNALMYVLGNSPFNVHELSIEQTIRSNQVNGVLIRTKIGRVDVVPIEGNEIRATLEGKTTKKWMKDYQLVVDEDQGLAQIEVVQESRFRFIDIYTDFKLTVGIPAAKLNQLQVETDSGNIHIGSVDASEYLVTSDTGSIKLDIKKGHIHAKTDTGEIVAALDHIDHDIIVATDTGDITVQTAQVPKSLHTKLTTDSGKVNVSLPDYHDGKIGEGGPLVDLFSDTGNLTIKQK